MNALVRVKHVLALSMFILIAPLIAQGADYPNYAEQVGVRVGESRAIPLGRAVRILFDDSELAKVTLDQEKKLIMVQGKRRGKGELALVYASGTKIVYPIFVR